MHKALKANGWMKQDDYTYALASESGSDDSGTGFFEGSGSDLDAAYTVYVNGIEVSSYIAAGTDGTESGVYVVELVLNEGYAWTDGTEGSKTFTFIVYTLAKVSVNDTAWTSEGGEGTEESPYVYIIGVGDLDNTVFFTSLDSDITMTYALDDDEFAEGSADTTATASVTDSYYAGLNGETELSFFGGALAGLTNGYYTMTVSVNGADATEINSSTAAKTTESTTGTYVVTITLGEGCYWADGTNNTLTFTFTVWTAKVDAETEFAIDSAWTLGTDGIYYAGLNGESLSFFDSNLTNFSYYTMTYTLDDGAETTINSAEAAVATQAGKYVVTTALGQTYSVANGGIVKKFFVRPAMICNDVPSALGLIFTAIL